MDFNIVMMELKRLKKNMIIGIVGPAAYATLIMVFYIAFSGIMSEVNHIFKNASLQVLLRAFSMDVNTFSYILNFYVSYNGVYVLLMGVIFSATLGVHLFSKELTLGTYEFLYSNPISRTKIFISKSVVIVVYLLLLNLTIFLVGFIGIELLKEKSPQIAWASEENIDLLENKITSENIMDLFDINDDLFYANMYKELEGNFSLNMTSVSVENVDTESMSDLLAVFLTNPDGIYDEMLESPDQYMALFKINNENLYRSIIRTQKNIYFDNKEKFRSDSDYLLDLYHKNPDLFLKQIVDQDQVERFSDKIALSEQERDELFIYYSFNNYLELSFVTFVVMLSVASFSIMLTVVIPKGKYSSGFATGLAFVFYMVSMMSNITEKTHFLKYFSPLAYLNMDVMAIDYRTPTWAWMSMFSIILFSTLMAILAFNKNDLIS